MSTAEPELPNAGGSVAPERLPHRTFRPAVREGHAGARNAAKVPLGLLGAVALVAAVEASIVRAGPRFLDPVGYCWALAAEAAKTEAPGCGVLLVGDSLVKHGLAPRVVSEKTSQRAYNLAIPAAPAPATEAVLRRAFDAGARPDAVVVDLKPGLLAGGPKYSLRYWPQVLSPSDAVRLAMTTGSSSFAGELLLHAALPSFRSRHEIRGDLMAALGGETGPLRKLNALGERHWSVNEGANLATPRADYSGDVSEAEHTRYLSRGFSAHRVNAMYARRIIGLALDRGAKTYLLLPPAVPQLMERRTRTGAEGKYEAFVEKLRKEFPQLTVLDARASGYPPSAFVDPVHLSALGALALSDDVADVLRRDLDAHDRKPAGAWVRLPAYRERPLPDALEHVELSRARLEGKTK